MEDKQLQELKSLIQETRQLGKAKEKIQFKKELKEQHLKDIKRLLKERKNLTEIETKIQKWKDEGYDVSELEDMVEKVNE